MSKRWVIQMGFRELNIKKSYSSDQDNVLFDFYIPVLEKSYKYDRLAGFFTSSSLAVCAKGLYKFIQNGGEMRLIASPRLSKLDIDEIHKSSMNPELYISNLIIQDIENMKDNEVIDHVKVLGWMIANKKLEIKVAIVYDEDGRLMNADKIEEKGIFHQKVGILYDDQDNLLSFSGSINESASAWIDNIEEFKVFKSWIDLEKDYLDPDVEKFDRLWNESSQRIKLVSQKQLKKN
jgi:hypothetical protein